MGRHISQGARRTAQSEASSHNSITNGTQFSTQGKHAAPKRDSDRARQTQRQRKRRALRNELKVPREHSVSPRKHTTYDQDSDIGGPSNSVTDAESLQIPQRDSSSQKSTTSLDELFEDDRAVQPVQQHSSPHGQLEHAVTDSASDDGNSSTVGALTESRDQEHRPLRPPASQLSTTPAQYGSSYHLPLNRNLHPPRPVQPATRREPIRMFSSGLPPEFAALTYPISQPGPEKRPAAAEIEKRPATSETKKRPVNTYKGSNIVKRLCQNKKLQRILLDKPQPRPRKNPDRMILKCTGKKEYR